MHRTRTSTRARARASTRTRATVAVLLSSAALLSACGSEEPSEPAAAPTAAAPSPTADPAAEWRLAVTDLCGTLSGEVSGRILQAGMDGRVTPAEVLSGEKAARPAVEAFDAGLAALTAPPEAAAAQKALTDLLTRTKPSVADLLAAANAGDQAKLNAVFAAREKLRLSPQGIPSLVAAGLPESCYFRTAYS